MLMLWLMKIAGALEVNLVLVELRSGCSARAVGRVNACRSSAKIESIKDADLLSSHMLHHCARYPI
jgi:hypothetical protein